MKMNKLNILALSHQDTRNTKKSNMKKSFFIFILFLSPLLIQGQNFKAGIRFGICGSQVNGDNLSGFNKAGIVAGAFVNRNLSKPFNMQMEIVYIQKGSRKPTDDANSYYRLRVHYIVLSLSKKNRRCSGVGTYCCYGLVIACIE